MSAEPTVSQPGAPTPGGGELAARAPAVDSAEWRHVHKITPVIEAWRILAVILVIAVANGAQGLAEVFEAGGVILTIALAVIAGALILTVAVSFLYSWFAWKKMRYAVGADAVYFHKGIIFRQQRHARLNRIQAVDVVHPLLGRLFGLAAVNIESAGGADSNVTIRYLPDAVADQLRAEVLARAAGVDPTADATTGQQTFQVAPEREVFQLSGGTLLLSLLLSGVPLTALVITATVIPSVIWAESLAAALTALPALFAGVGYAWNRFAGEFGFRLAISPDGLRVRAGLLSTRSQTIPPRRVQAIGLTQPLLWRKKDWWRVQANIAGYVPSVGSSDSDSKGMGARTVLLPVGSREEAVRLLWLLLPDLGVDDPAAVLEAAFTGTLDDGGFLHSPRAARWLDPIIWRRNGLRITRTALLMRGGRLTRRVAVVPHERTQSLRLEQGPLERRLAVADFVADSVMGPVTVRAAHLPQDAVAAVLFEQAERARTARSHEGPEEWMRRVGVPQGAPQPATPIAPAVPATPFTPAEDDPAASPAPPEAN